MRLKVKTLISDGCRGFKLSSGGRTSIEMHMANDRVFLFRRGKPVLHAPASFGRLGKPIDAVNHAETE